MSKSSEGVISWRKNTKARMVKAMGGCCAICGYDRCNEALEFHHIDPKQKDFSLGNTRANPKAWTVLVNELRKCVLVCSNCHKEIHSGINELPNVIPKFDEKYTNYKDIEKELKWTKCPVCDGPKRPDALHCSPKCSSTTNNKGNWDLVDLPIAHLTLTLKEIGDIVGVSSGAVRKRLKKLGIR